MTACGWCCSWGALLLSERFHRCIRRLQITDRDQRLRMFGPAILIEQVIDVGTGAFQCAIARRNIGLQFVHAMRGLGAIVNRHPDALFLRNHLALSVERSAAWAVAHILRTRHRTDVFHQAQNAVAASLASEQTPASWRVPEDRRVAASIRVSSARAGALRTCRNRAYRRS